MTDNRLEKLLRAANDATAILATTEQTKDVKDALRILNEGIWEANLKVKTINQARDAERGIK